MKVLDMGLSKVKLGDYIELCEEKNSDGRYGIDDVKGIANTKEFIETKANLEGVSLANYRVVKPNCFSYIEDTSRRGEKVSLAFNSSAKSFLVSSISTVFQVKDESKLLPGYLFMFFKRPEFDRYARFNSWGSARETFTWEDMCNIEIELPPLEIQRKYVAIYEALEANLKAYESKLEDLKLAYEGYIEDLRKKTPSVKIGSFISESNLKNLDSTLKYAVGISVAGVFNSKRTSKKDSLRGCKILEKHDIFYASQTTCGIGIGAIGIYEQNEKAICAPTCTIIKCKKVS